MNICIISPSYPYKDNMTYVFVKKLVDEWAKMGHRCVVLTPFSLVSFVRRIKRYVPYHYTDIVCPETPVEVYNPRYISLPKIHICGAELNEVVISRMFLRTLKRIGFQPDIIYGHFFRSAIPGWYLAQKTGASLFVACGESTVDTLYPPSRGFTWERFRNDIRGCVCVSSKNRDEAIQKGLVTAEQCTVIPNGTNLEVFRKMDRSECRRKLGFGEEDFIVTCVGGLIERKGQNRILEAVRRLANPRIKMVFIGKGDLTLEHESILFKGMVNNGDIPVYLNASNVFCLPTLAEGCCNAVVEAMACGVPIVSSDLPFNYDVLDDRNALLVDPLDIDAIAAAIKRLFEDSALCESFSAISLERTRGLSIGQRARSVLVFMESRL